MAKTMLLMVPKNQIIHAFRPWQPSGCPVDSCWSAFVFVVVVVVRKWWPLSRTMIVTTRIEVVDYLPDYYYDYNYSIGE